MAILKTQGLIIKEINVGEADKIFTIFTRSHGKVKASARGVRNPRSRLVSGTQFLCYSDFVLYKGKEIYRISQSQVIKNFYNLRTSIEKLSYATYFADLTSEVIEENYPSNKILNLLLNTLYLLSETDKDPMLLKAVYELRLMSIIGYTPNLINCSNCGTAENLKYFSSKAGGLICIQCAKNAQQGRNFELSQGTIQAMRYIIYSPVDKIFSFKVSQRILKELNNILSDFIITHTETEIKSLKYLNNILEMNKEEKNI